MRQTADIALPKLAIVLARAARSLAEFLEAGLALQGILTIDFLILEVLLHKGPLAMLAIGQKVPRANAPLRGAIDRLKRRGLVRVQADQSNLHAAVYELTAEGHETITRIYDRHEKDIEAALGILSPTERSQLSRALKKIGFQCRKYQHVPSTDGRGGLAPWQLRRATEYITEHLTDPVPLKELAGQTGLSPSRFGRAFKVSMGISPHRWQMNLRIVEAQELLREGNLSQTAIALATGFAEQSHFSRVFKDVVGVSPGVWQREHRP